MEAILTIGKIKIGKQFRTDLGDLEELAESIRQGLLQPIGVTPKHELVFGYRRLVAHRDILKRKTIPARIVDVPSILEGMLTENLVRKDFTVSERVAIFRAIKAELGNRRGQRTDLGLMRNCAEVGPGETTEDFAAKRSGLGNRRTAERAETVVEAGVPELVEAMDTTELSVSAAAEVASLGPRDQRAFLKGHDQARATAQQVRTYRKIQRITQAQDEERKAIWRQQRHREWTITNDQSVVPCHLLITDPPQGILPSEKWDNPPEGIEAFTRDWCRRWSKCGANYIAIFWNQNTKWDAKRWFDESLESYEFLQECCCHRRNYKKPEGVHGTHQKFRNAWEPVFIYRRKGLERTISFSNHDLGSDLTDNDHHSASYPTMARNGDSFQQHKCQKPISAMRWLIHGLTLAGEKVADCFCGSASSGIAATQLGRTFHGIEADKEYRKLAEARLAAFGTPDRPAIKVKSLKPNSVTEGHCLDLIPLLPNASIHLVVTSPMYAEQRKDHYQSVSAEDYPEFTLRWMTALWDKLTDDGSIFIVIRPDLKNGVIQDYVLRTRLLLRESGWKECETLIWHKRDGGCCLGSNRRPRRTYEEILWFSKTHEPHIDVNACGGSSDDVSFRWTTRFGRQNTEAHPGPTRMTDVIDVPVGIIEAGIQHPAMFPVELAEILIKTFCPAKGSVLDNFCGSGSTLLGVKRAGEGRSFYGFDIEPHYVAIARQRLAGTNGQQVLPLKPTPNGNGRNGAAGSSRNGRHVPSRPK